MDQVNPGKTFVSKAHLTNDGNWIYFGTVNNTEDAAGDEVSLYFAGDTRGHTFSNFLKANTWYHMVAVYDGTQSDNAGRVKIYVDGVSQALTFNGTFGATSPTETRNVVIGATSNGQRFLTGRQDDTRIYSRALTAAEIKQLYNMGR